MEWFDAAKTWLTDNAIVLGALVAVFALGGYVLKPFRSLFAVANATRGDTFVEKVYDDLREARTQRDDHATAAQYLQSELQSAQEENDGLKKAIAGLVAKESPQADDALEHLRKGDTEQAKRLYREIGETKANEGTTANKEAAEAYVNLGAIAFLNDTDEALTAYAKATEFDPENADAWNKLGILQGRKGDLDAAEASYNKLLSLLQPEAEKGKLAVALGNLGVIAHNRGNSNDAEDFQNRSLTLFREIGYREGMAVCLGNLGLITQSRGDYGNAIAYHQQSLAIHDELDNKVGRAIALSNLGLIAYKQDHLDIAEELLTCSLALNEELGRKEGTAIALSNLGLVAKIHGNLDKTYTLWAQAQNLFEELGMPHKVEEIQGWIDSLDDEDSD